MTDQNRRDTELQTGTTRRRVLKTGLGAAVGAGTLPLLSRRASAHFPDRLAIDIKPGCARNPINPKSQGVIPVSVSRSEFERDGKSVVFDPTERAVRYRFGAPETVESGGGARPAHGGHVETRSDAPDILVLHFPTGETGFDGDESTGKLLWERDKSGKHGYAGTDQVTIVK